jgi:hypothetical protein
MRLKKTSVATFALVIAVLIISPLMTVSADVSSNTCLTSTEHDDKVNVIGTCTNPLPLGKVIDIPSGGRSFRFAVAEVIRGPKAWKRLSKFSPSNKPPGDGKEYLMVMLVVRYLDGPINLPKGFHEFNFKMMSSGQLLEQSDGIVYVRPEFKIDYNVDAPGAGWVVAEVDPADPNPLLVIMPELTPDTTYYLATNLQP